MPLTAEDLINRSATYADGLLGDAKDVLRTAGNEIHNVINTETKINPYFETFDGPMANNNLTIESPKKFDTSKLHIDTSGEPTVLPAFMRISDIHAGAIPTIGAVAPVLGSVDKPTALGDFQLAPPSVDLNVLFPDVPPELSRVYNEPVIQDHGVPTAPDIVLPSFDAVEPNTALTDPGDYAKKLIDTYREIAPEMTANASSQVDSMINKFNPKFNEQMDAIEQRITKNLNGGTGIPDAVENALYERAKEKTAAEYKRTVAAARDSYAKMGFKVPGGVVANALMMARQAAADNNARAAQDIAIKRSEQELNNMQFTLTKSVEVRMQMVGMVVPYMNALISINGMALDAGKAVVNAEVERFNALLRVVEARINVYKTQAQIYQIKMDGAMKGIELYKAEIEALRALTEVDKAKVEIYRAEIDTLQAYASIYKTKVEAAVSRSQLEKLKIDIYSAQVEARRTEVSAKSAEWEAYKAALQGNESLVNLYAKQIDADKTRIEAYKADIDTQTAVIRAQQDHNDALAKIFDTQMQIYKTKVGVQTDVAKAEIELHREESETYRLEMQRLIALYNEQVEYYKTQFGVWSTKAKITNDDSVRSTELNLEKIKTSASLSKDLAQVYTTGAGAALNQVNTLVQMSN